MLAKRGIPLAFLAVLIISVGHLRPGVGDLPPGPSTWYVSRLGDGRDGSDGRSWTTAWDELASIDWAAVRPGDTILLDGGERQMVYGSTLELGRSGEPGAPITLKLAEEPGRNGRVVIFGGRSAPLGYCGQREYMLEPARDNGIDTGENAWVVIDGTKWRGIEVYGHNREGIRLRRESSDITVRNVEVYDNGWWTGSVPDGPGISLSGARNTVERAIVHDNGQDAFQSSGGLSEFALRDSWLYNARPHPNDDDQPFNYCRHSDGIQVWSGGRQRGLLIEHSVIGPGFLQGVLLGEPVGSNPATVDDVTIRDSLFIKAASSNIDTAKTEPLNWLLENVTSVGRGPEMNNIAFKGGEGHAIRQTIAAGGHQNYFAGQTALADNCWGLNTFYELGPGDLKADPMFARVSESALSLDDDYTPRNPLCQGRGASLTSIASLFQTPP